MGTWQVRLVDRYVHRMIIEYVISDTISVFPMDALNASVPMKINVDAQLAVIASVLYRLLELRIGRGFEFAEVRTLFQDLAPSIAEVTITDKDIIVSYPRRASIHTLCRPNATNNACRFRD